MGNIQLHGKNICEVCNKKFASEANLKRHQEIHEVKKVCPHCSATFSFKDGLKRHIKTQHEQIRPSVKDGEFGSQPKRALSGTESGNQLTGQELNIKKRRISVDLDDVDKLTLKLQREQAEKNCKQAENEMRLEKNLIIAKASAIQLRSERAEKEKENAKLREQITHLQKELQKLKEMERDTNRNSQAEKENLEKKVKTLTDENTRMHQQLKYTRDENTRINQQIKYTRDVNTRIKQQIKQTRDKNTRLNQH